MKRIVALAGALAVVVIASGAAFFLTRTLVQEGPRHTEQPAAETLPGGGAGNNDRNEGAALIAEAEALTNRGDTREAAQSYAKALAIFRAQQDLVGEASVAFGLGRIEHFMGQSDTARAKYSQALELYSKAGDALGQSRVLVAMGDLEKDTFHWNEAVEYYRQAREAWAAAPEPKADPHVLLRMAAAPAMPGGERQAWSDLEQALLIYETIGDDKGLGDVQMLFGVLNWNLGDVRVARQHFAEALALFRESAGPTDQANATLEMARSDLYLGFNLNSVELIAQALALFTQAENQEGIAKAGVVQGDIERLQGRMAAARDRYAAAAVALEILGHIDQPAALQKLAQVEIILGDWEAARVTLEAAIGLYQTVSDIGGEAAATLELGGLRGFADLIERAIGLFEGVGDSGGEGRAHLELAGVGAEQDPEAARSAYATAARLFEKAALPIGQVLAELGLADLESKSENDEVARTHFGRAQEILAAMEDPLAEANRFLGLPPVSTLFAARGLADHQYNDGVAAAGPLEIAEAEANERANLAQFPDHNSEGRAVLTSVGLRLSAAPL